jgi:hypothetical protein
MDPAQQSAQSFIKFPTINTVKLFVLFFKESYLCLLPGLCSASRPQVFELTVARHQNVALAGKICAVPGDLKCPSVRHLSPKFSTFHSLCYSRFRMPAVRKNQAAARDKNFSLLTSWSRVPVAEIDYFAKAVQNVVCGKAHTKGKHMYAEASCCESSCS